MDDGMSVCPTAFDWLSAPAAMESGLDQSKAIL